MWSVELEGLVGQTPAEQLWVIAQAREENGGPAAYVAALRGVADRLEEVGLLAGRDAEGVVGG